MVCWWCESCRRRRGAVQDVYSMFGQRKTFAQALGNTCDIPLSQLPTLCIKGDMIVVRIDEADYLVGLED